ncbi:hypothetical protein C8J57DRAFT_1524954 [Mycena rebaudengoi]|nr:hypothetical protein C8J57DRAFT_1524954 [Mycena rebaudengoi]
MPSFTKPEHPQRLDLCRLALGTIPIAAGPKALTRLWIHRDSSKAISRNRGVPLTQESATALVQYLTYRDILDETRSMVIEEILARELAGEDIRIISDALRRCLDNLFETSSPADEMRGHNILKHLAQHQSISPVLLIAHLLAAYPPVSDDGPIPEPRKTTLGGGVWHEVLSHRAARLDKVLIYASAEHASEDVDARILPVSRVTKQASTAKVGTWACTISLVIRTPKPKATMHIVEVGTDLEDDNSAPAYIWLDDPWHRA